MARRLGVCLLVVAAGCSWTRFDDVQDNAPVVLLNAPSNVRGFGASLATASEGGRVHLMVGGAAKGPNGAALFSLGTGQSPATDALDASHCGQGCFVAQTIAALATAQAPASQRSACFATGYTPSSVGGTGIFVRCNEASATPFEYTLPLPAAVSFDPSQEALLLASDKSAQPALLAALPAAGQAWFYAAGSLSPTELAATSAEPSFGSALAVRSGGFAVGAPDQAHVWLFDATGTATACIAGPAGFGRALAAGEVNGDGAQDLVVADADTVHVLSGAALATLSSTTCAAFDSGAELAALACRSTSDAKGCGSADFGAALAVGDIDGDGDGEVAVGAPDMTIRGESRGGAVLVYDVEGERPTDLTEARFIASAEANDRLGASVIMASQPDRDLLVAGGTGGKVAVFYCSKLSKRGSRCE